MNENQNPNLGNPVGNPAPGGAPVTPAANPNLASAPVNTVANPNIAPAPVNAGAPTPNPAPVPTPGVAPVNPQVPGQAPVPGTAVPPVNNPAAPGMNPAGAAAPLPGMTPNVAPNTPQMGAAPMPNAPAGEPASGITIDPNALNTIAPAPAGGPNPNDGGDTKKFDTKTIILVAAAIVAVIIAIIYFVVLKDDKKPAPAANTNVNENVTQNTTGNTTSNTTDNTTNNTVDNTTPDPEPTKASKYDMSWMGSYTADDGDSGVIITYSNPGAIELVVAKEASSGANVASISLDVDSTEKLTYDDDYLGEELKLELIKTADGIKIKAECSDKDSVFNNLDGELKKYEVEDTGWSGFYQTDGGQIVINQYLDKAGDIMITSESSKYTNLSTTFEIKNGTITIKSKSFSKDDTKIKKDGDKLIVTSDEYLEGTYEKLSD